MSADVSSSYAGAPPAKRSGIGRAGLAVFGVAVVVVGGFLLLNPYEAARTLALLIGLALLVGGCLEIALAWGSDHRGQAILPGAVLVVGGLATAFWPEATLWTLAVLTALSLLIHGIGRVALAFLGRSEIPGWGWYALAGAFNIAFGVIALAWPEATVAVLSLILGAQVIVFGLFLLFAAFTGSRAEG
jgi:uncharacterized membrane protein HdeD (DUF308 family)